MTRDFSLFLWLMKLGALANLYFLANALRLDAATSDPSIVVPAVILFAVSGYRCLFPNRYKDNVVLHDSALSSTLVTRVLATFSEVAYIYQFSHVLRLLNTGDVVWVDALSWLMVVQVVVSQFCVWGAIATERLSLYVYEELGWFVMFAANTAASAFLYTSVEGLGARELLLELNLMFGVVYLPWQVVHLYTLLVDARETAARTVGAEPITRQQITGHLHRALHVRKRATDGESWGGIVGLTWMVAYWATLIPLWVHQIVQVAAAR